MSFCPGCGANLTAGANFCHRCGGPLAGRPRPHRWWPVAVAALLVSAVAIGWVVGAGAGRTPAADQRGVAAPDISSLTPRERADRLFNRIMAAAERGDTGEVRFFTPMALEAYRALGASDADVWYHRGAIALANANWAAALSSADSITDLHRDHLLAAILRGRAFAGLDNGEQLALLYRTFLAAEARERSQTRAEYEEHAALIAAFAIEARQAQQVP